MCPARPPVPAPRHVTASIPIFTQTPLSEATWHAFTARTSVQDSVSPVIVLAPHTPVPPCQYSHQFPPAASWPQPDADQTTRFSIRWARRERRESHGLTLPSAPSSRSTATETLLLPHPAASPVTPPRQRARPTVAATTSLPGRRAPSIIPPLVTEPATGRPDTVTGTGLRRTTSRGSIR